MRLAILFRPPFFCCYGEPAAPLAKHPQAHPQESVEVSTAAQHGFTEERLYLPSVFRCASKSRAP